MNVELESSGLRISLREFLLFVGAVAVSFAVLQHANAIWLSVVAGLAMLSFMVSSVIALVDRGRRQAFALGFSACLATYMSIFFVETEVHPYQGRFPTTQLLRVFFESGREQLYIDEGSGEGVLARHVPPGARIVEDFSWTMTPPPSQGGAIMTTPQVSIRSSLSSGRAFRRIGDVPSRDVFIRLGHLLWALFFGYAGGHLASLIYVRRLRRNAPTTETSLLPSP